MVIQAMSDRFRSPARVLHWVTAALVIAVVIPAGVWIRYFEPADQALKMRLYNLHESFGVVVFALVLMRLVYRWSFPPPAWPIGTPVWVRLLAGLSHSSLYALLILMPVTGFLATNAWGFPLKVFEVIPLPSPIGKDEALAKALSLTHWCGAVSMGVLLVAHLLGGFYHRFVARDSLARRMF